MDKSQHPDDPRETRIQELEAECEELRYKWRCAAAQVVSLRAHAFRGLEPYEPLPDALRVFMFFAGLVMTVTALRLWLSDWPGVGIFVFILSIAGPSLLVLVYQDSVKRRWSDPPAPEK